MLSNLYIFQRLSRDIVKDTSDQALYAQMKQRHAKARRISQLVLKHQHTSDDLYAYQNHDSDQESIERKSNLHKSYKHGNGSTRKIRHGALPRGIFMCAFLGN